MLSVPRPEAGLFTLQCLDDNKEIKVTGSELRLYLTLEQPLGTPEDQTDDVN